MPVPPDVLPEEDELRRAPASKHTEPQSRFFQHLGTEVRWGDDHTAAHPSVPSCARHEHTCSMCRFCPKLLSRGRRMPQAAGERGSRELCACAHGSEFRGQEVSVDMTQLNIRVCRTCVGPCGLSRWASVAGTLRHGSHEEKRWVRNALPWGSDVPLINGFNARSFVENLCL